ncbi:S8 family peptidase [Nesterenkonia flava]|uniref:S8 family peptidase n=1 Tax=Nesterenkonia flava TaxID=469799 RepID=A0ABU1FWJ6_9MICC|nr:S8 family peptidase [Nesterenkonia flava]MDR5713052.1 S8 family peptidase [Nesterenkonia flava]
MATRDRPHIVVPRPPSEIPFTLVNPSRDSEESTEFPGGDRRGHGKRLSDEYRNALVPTEEKEASGSYISFVSFPDLSLALSSLEVQRDGDYPELVAVQDKETEHGLVQTATVYVPDGKKEYFLTKLRKYVETVGDESKARHSKLIEGIQSVQRATVKDLWTDPELLFPEDPSELRWWEVWLRSRDGKERERFTTFASHQDLLTSSHYLGFGDRTVVMVRATINHLAETFRSLDDIAELRRPHDVASLITNLPAAEQAEWADDLRRRLEPATEDAPVVCILDTGVQNSHPLLTDSISPADQHVANAQWRIQPVHAHGTEMAGLALYGDLHEAIRSSHPVRLGHRLESVKILPDSGQNERDLYGALTAQAVDRPEIQSFNRPRVYMLAVTAPRKAPSPSGDKQHRTPEAGKPTSWSASLDALAYGRAIDTSDPNFTYLDRDESRAPRLFVVSAGNIPVDSLNAAEDHLDRSDAEPVEDPAQAWNVLTVGAFSDNDDMAEAPKDFYGYEPVSPRGDLSPVSRTSVSFDRKKWPFKPEVVADGGNLAVSAGKTHLDTPPNLGLLTTRLQQPGSGLFTTTRDTSAATAQVAAIAADIYSEYPNLRPETVRALIVHSAQWTPKMTEKINSAANKGARVNLLRRYGMGVPNIDRALRSAGDSLTLIAESSIRPYEREGATTDARTREMKLHELPWPTSELEALGETQVQMRVTLSYFVEPNPSNRGWTGKYLYPSYGLRFAARRADESVVNFRKRINKRDRAEGERSAGLDTEKGWLFGSNQQQAAGSLHTDIWTGDAAALAHKGALAVYPVLGWWKNRPTYDQSDQGVDYSLVISIEAPEVEVDLWTPVMQQIRSVVEIGV